jgi:hypothetical protein
MDEIPRRQISTNIWIELRLNLSSTALVSRNVSRVNRVPGVVDGVWVGMMVEVRASDRQH